MPSSYILSSLPKAIAFKFTVGARLLSRDILNKFNISPGQYAPVIINEKPHEIQLLKFGLTPLPGQIRNEFFQPAPKANTTR